MAQVSEETIFTLILHSGNGRSSAFEAIAAAKEGDSVLAKEKLQEAQDALNEAHKSQTGLIQNEAQGEPADATLLLIHAQDHLMTAMVVLDLAKEFVELYEKLGKEG